MEEGPSLADVMRRGSLRAAEEITGHKYETNDVWLKRVATHAEALAQVLVGDLHLSQVEIDDFLSFVQKKTAQLGSLTKENAGDALVQDRDNGRAVKILDSLASPMLPYGRFYAKFQNN